LSERDAAAAPTAWQRHDLVVVAVVAALFVAGAFAHRRLVAPTLTELAQDGLRMSRPTGYFPPEDVPPAATSLAAFAGVGGDNAVPTPPRFHKLYRTPAGPLMALEIRIEAAPAYRGLGIVLQQSRHDRYGDTLWVASSDERRVGDRARLRTEFRYATRTAPGDAPQIATGIEYAALNGGRLYVVTAHGSESEARRLESLALSTLTLEATR
jgi:hypothetical protein